MILFVDDCPRRQAALRKSFGPAVMIAGSIGVAVYYLSISDVDAGFTTIYLDYDGVDGDLLAEWMARHRPLPNVKVIIHSSNYVGAIKMRGALQAAGYDVEMTAFAEVVKSVD
ncbi:MAG: cyclic-phosphate processing receiver domain-containing protein [Planctomycetota bacterium]